MKRAAAVLCLLLSACANGPTRPAEYVTPEGAGWVISYRSSPLSGSTHLYINGKLVASGSFGVAVGNNAQGSGRYAGKAITFTCVERYTPHCLVYADGHRIAELVMEPAAPASP